jgi:hypothetical protein
MTTKDAASEVRDERAKAYYAFIVNECLRLGVPESDMPDWTPFNRLVETLETACQASSWQPMATVPRDGREVLLLVERRDGMPHRTLVGHYMIGGHCIEDHPAIDSGWYFWNGCMFDKASKPINWMPLPLPHADEPTGELPTGDSLERANADYHALEGELCRREPVGYTKFTQLLNGGLDVLAELRDEWLRLRRAIASHFGPDSLEDYSPVEALERACNIEMRKHWHTFTSLPTTAELSRLRAERDEYSHAYTALVHGDPLPDGKYPHTLTCNADHRQPIGCDMCSCHVGRPIKKLRAAEAQLTALRQRLERVEGALRNIVAELDGELPADDCCRSMTDIARAALQGE